MRWSTYFGTYLGMVALILGMRWANDPTTRNLVASLVCVTVSATAWAIRDIR